MTEKHSFSPHILRYDTLSSTSSRLKRLLEEGENLPPYTAVVTPCQSAGRGQGTNRWVSNPHENLTFSMLLYPDIPAEKHFCLNMCVSLGIKKALEAYMDDVLIKWPNDIYHHDRKLCGILIESTIKGGKIIRSIAGIGINVCQTQWEDWVPNPASILSAVGKKADADDLMYAVMENIHDYIRMMNEGGERDVYSLYHEVMYRKDVSALYKDSCGEYRGVIRHVDDMGRLCVEREDTGEIQAYMFKEVKFL